jgi:hypothetical protein
MSIFTSSLLRPQKEQCKVFFAIIAYYNLEMTGLQSYPTYWILTVAWKKQSRPMCHGTVFCSNI